MWWLLTGSFTVLCRKSSFHFSDFSRLAFTLGLEKGQTVHDSVKTIELKGKAIRVIVHGLKCGIAILFFFLRKLFLCVPTLESVLPPWTQGKWSRCEQSFHPTPLTTVIDPNVGPVAQDAPCPGLMYKLPWR